VAPGAYHADVGVRERSDQFKRLARSAITDLFDQRRPFGRLALTHVLMTAGDTLFAVSLAGSLFFSISPTAAKDKVLLYLLLTMGPFAVVAPALGPLIDRSRGARRAMVVASAVGRAALCPFLARDIHSLLLFPEAFAMLVLSKVYLVTKGALVPEMAALGMLDEATDTALSTDIAPSGGTNPSTGTTTDDGLVPTYDEDVWAAAPGPSAVVGMSGTASVPDSPEPTPPYGTPVIRVEDPGTGKELVEPDLATLNARLGLLASLAGFVFAVPAVIILKLGGAPSVIWVSIAVFAAAAVAGARLPVPSRLARAMTNRRSESGARYDNDLDRTVVSADGDIQMAPDFDPEWVGDEQDLAAFRPFADTEVILALMPMSVLKALVGFTTFLFAFGLRRSGAATWWFGFVLGGLTAGALIGVLLVSRIRRSLNEQQMLTGSLLLVTAVTVAGAFYTARWFWAVIALVVGLASAVAKPSFDALVQRHVSESNQGRAFARFETRFQLMWVVGSFVPVVLSLPVAAGSLVMAVVAAVGAVSYMSSRRAVQGSQNAPRRMRSAN
jgi:Major Facilitator Superfamily